MSSATKAPGAEGLGDWVLVPRVATKAMLDAAYAAHDAYEASETGGWGGLGSVYAAMIASAPAPSDPAGAGGDLGELERLCKAAAKLIAKWDGAPELPEEMEQALSQFEDAWAWADEFLSNRSGQLVASTPGQKGAGEEKTGAPAPGVLWSAWSETDADSDPSDPSVTYCTEWFVGRWPIGAEEPDCRILIGTSRSAEIIARRVAENLTSILNTDRIRAAPSGWRTDCFRTRMSEFDAAYKKACASSQPKDWMDAALFAQQFRNVAYAVLTGEAPEQEIPNKLRLKPCPWEEEHLCSYPKCNCAPDREPDPPASCDEHPQGEDPQGAESRSDASAVGEVETPAQTPPSPPSATPEGDPPMTVEEAREILAYERGRYNGAAKNAAAYLRWRAGLVSDDQDERGVLLLRANAIELALRTLHAAGEVR